MRIQYLTVIAVLLTSCDNRKQSSISQEDVDSITSVSESKVDLVERYTFRDAQLKEYERFTNQLDASDADNIKTATEKFKLLFENKEKPTSDSALYLFERFYSRVDDKINERHNGDTTNYDSLIISLEDSRQIELSKRLTDYADKLTRNGFQLSMTEGITYIKKDRDYVKEHFYSKLTPSMVNYLEQLNKENKEGFTEDGGLVIEPVTLIDRIAWWENFNKSNPAFIFKETPYYRQKIYTATLITGEDNTPLFYDEGGPLDVYYKNAYDYLFNKYPDTEAAKLLRPYYSSLVKSDTTEIRKFREKNLNRR
jgi:hypothetical protein